MVNNILTSGSFTSINQAADSIQRKSGAEGKESNISAVSFQDILNQKKSIAEAANQSSLKTDSLRFSKHADLRLKQRDITLTDEQLARLSEGTQKACLKGIKESLVLLDDMAFIVNTQNKTVVTAMDKNMNDENIFTNIDGAVII